MKTKAAKGKEDRSISDAPRGLEVTPLSRGDLWGENPMQGTKPVPRRQVLPAGTSPDRQPGPRFPQDAGPWRQASCPPALGRAHSSAGGRDPGPHGTYTRPTTGSHAGHPRRASWVSAGTDTALSTSSGPGPSPTATPRLRITDLLPKPHLLALPISQSPAATAARHTGRWQVWNVRREAGSQPPPLLLTTGGGGASVSQT